MASLKFDSIGPSGRSSSKKKKRSSSVSSSKKKIDVLQDNPVRKKRLINIGNIEFKGNSAMLNDSKPSLNY
jgi:hypothetical protein